MKNLYLIFFLLATSNLSNAQSVAINTDNSDADASAILDVKSTTSGVLLPRMTKAERDLIVTPATGLLVYQNDVIPGYYMYNGTSWELLGGGGMLGEVRMFAISETGAITKLNLQSKGWAICDGTTPTVQGITGATLTSTPDLQNKFIQMSSNETSGTTGSGNYLPSHTHTLKGDNVNGGYTIDMSAYGTSGGLKSGWIGTTSAGTALQFYEMAFFIKVK